MSRRETRELREELITKMHALSEDYWSASWHDDLEFMLWEELQGIKSWRGIPEKELAELRSLVERAGGWARFLEDGERPAVHDRTVFVPMPEWLPRYATWKAKP